LTLNFAKQIATLKAKMTEQGAQLLISAESSMPPTISPNLHRSSGVLKKKTTSNGSSARLEPIEGSIQSQYMKQSPPSYFEANIDPYSVSEQYQGRNTSNYLGLNVP
jgi:hypothetical protein